MSLSGFLSFSVNRAWWRREARHANKPPDSRSVFTVMWLLKEARLISDFLEEWIGFLSGEITSVFTFFHASVLVSAALPKEHEKVQMKTEVTFKDLSRCFTVLPQDEISFFCQNKVRVQSMGSKPVSLTGNAMDCILTLCHSNYRTDDHLTIVSTPVSNPT